MDFFVCLTGIVNQHGKKKKSNTHKILSYYDGRMGFEGYQTHYCDNR
jgi:hypothetical protein